MTKHLVLAALLLANVLASARAEDRPRPLNFSYTAIDGTEVDLAKMRGQVVLIFFWATWSKPSRDAVKPVVGAYHKYHNKGFAVLGVSLDSDENAMKNYADGYSMNWPQYFDGKGEQNDVAKTMGVKELPSLWLIGKDGRVISVNQTGSLDAQIEKALAAK